MQTYILQALDRVKIGKSMRFKKRLPILQVGSGTELIVRLLIDGNYEKALHYKFKKLRLHGEWFQLTEEIEQLITAFKNCPDPLGLCNCVHVFDYRCKGHLDSARSMYFPYSRTHLDERLIDVCSCSCHVKLEVYSNGW